MKVSIPLFDTFMVLFYSCNAPYWITFFIAMIKSVYLLYNLYYV